MRLTIERLRTLVLIAGVLLVAALVGSLAVSHWKSRFNLSEVPKKLGVDIEQEANGVTYTQSRGGHTLFKIHASKVVQLKDNGKALLHDVQIELYGADGSRVDRIAGNEFEYDQKAGIATAAGPVEITLMKPGTAPAVAPKATPQQAVDNEAKGAPLSNAAQSVAAGQIQVKTSGLTFNQKTGTATTEQPVEFALAQGQGNAVGATFNSNNGFVMLDHAVELTVQRGPANVVVHARHAEFERSALECDLTGATAEYRNAKAAAGQSKILFRQDGSAIRLDARDGFALATANGGRVSAPQGWIEFDGKNQPTRGHLEGGVTMDSVTGGRQAHGTAPMADLEFGAAGALKTAHLERGVTMHSEEDVAGAHISRDWRSPVADVTFRTDAKGKTQLDSLAGQDGVVMTGQTRRGDGTMSPSQMSADAVTAKFDADGQLRQVVGIGHAGVEQTTAQGAEQTTQGDRLIANFSQGTKKNTQAASQIESATVDGNVVMTQKPAQKLGQPAQPELHATAAHAVYEGAGAWMHLTGNPRVVNGGMELTADKVDVAQQSGDAFAHGNVKATWVNDGRDKSSAGSFGSGSVGLDGQTPAHVIAAEARFHQATGEAVFHGLPASPARLWQDANSVAAPVIVLDRTKQTLIAHGSGPENPVRVVLLSAGQKTAQNKSAAQEVIRVRGGDLEYSDAARRAALRSAPGGRVTAETATARSTSDSVELTLLPAGTRFAGSQSGASQVDKMIARGNVVLTSQGRQGTGEQLVYTSRTGEYVLTGTAATPPRLSDPDRGTVTGTALIFNSRDDSVNIEGAGRKTTSQTTTSRAPGR